MAEPISNISNVEKNMIDKSVTVVLFGGTGDLAKKKILPALREIIERRVVNHINLISTGRRALSKEEYMHMMEMTNHGKIHINYLQMDFEKKNILQGLKNMLDDIEDDSCIGRVFYFAISPKYFGSLAKELSIFSRDKNKFNRLMFEKPFGEDLISSRKLNNSLTKYFDESDIFRVDHYLGKETVRNILSLRFVNPIFERTWNSEFIESINVIVSEDIGVGNRIEYYDNSGAIKDMIQNHMLQILSFILMDIPERTSSKFIHAKKLLALKKLSYKNVLIGQYEGYVDELNAHKRDMHARLHVNSSHDLHIHDKDKTHFSETETYVNLELYSNSKRWKGTRINLITGKNLDKKYALIELNYRKNPCKLYCDENTAPNKLVINVQPKQDVDFYINTPERMNSSTTRHVKMNFCKDCEFSESAPESYELILEECIRGEKTLFINSKELDYSWKLVDNVLSKLPKPLIYKKGTNALMI